MLITCAVVQNIFAKAGTLILQERMQVSPLLVSGSREKKISKWVSNRQLIIGLFVNYS